jgi:HSP20 family protein
MGAVDVDHLSRIKRSLRTGAILAPNISPAPAFPMAKRSLDPMNRMVGEFFGHRPPRPAPEPSLDVIERSDEIVVRAAVPGLKKQDLEVSVSGTLLTIRGNAEKMRREEEGEYYRAEIPHGPFERTLALPAEVDESKGKAIMKDGLLELTLPKLEKARRRTIRIE